MFVFAHVSDLHFDGTERISRRAERVARYLGALPGRLDAVLITGDIADHGADAEYAEALGTMALAYPLMWCPGNHDERRAYRRTLMKADADAGPVNVAHEIGGVTFAMCDSSIPGRDDGFLDDETLAWLDGVLSAAAGPSFVCFHHPPAPIGQPFVDNIRMSGEDRLADVVRRHPSVVALLCGHAHTAAASTFAGRPLLVAPGVKNTLLLPWEASDDDLLDDQAPPGIAFHVLDDDLRLTTHYRTIM